MIASVRPSPRVAAVSGYILILLGVQAALLTGTAIPQTTQNGPHMYVRDSQTLNVSVSGKPDAVEALATGQAHPLSSTAADIDEDGVTDLLVGYSTPTGGSVVLHRGNLDAFAPQSRASFLAIARGEFPSPFLSNAQVFNVPIRPDFLVTGNFSNSGHLGLVVASRGGNALYMFSGDGKGKFARSQVISLPGAITALAAGQFGHAGASTSLIVGVSGSRNSFSFSLYRGAAQGLRRLASYPLTAPSSAVAFGDLDGDSRPDVAVLAGGQVRILHSSSLQLETVSLPVSAVAMAVGSFIHDRRLRLQIALLTSDGSIHIVARSGFDPRAFTLDEARAMRLASLRGWSNPLVFDDGGSFDGGWTIVESFASVAPFGDPAALPLLLRTRISSHATDDVMVFNPAAGQMAIISHANVQAGAANFVPGAVSVRGYSGWPIATLSARVNVDGRPGVILLHENQVAPLVMMPLPDPTFLVNTTADTLAANGCAPGNPNTCSLREAIIEANASAGADTVMVPAGAYQLTIAPAAGADPHDATSGDLDITDGVSIVGADSATTIVEAGASAGSGIEKIFSINPLGLGAGFDSSISNLTLRFGKNPSVSGSGDEFGGALDWSAGWDGTGNLTITSCVITDNATTDGDGGGIALSNPAGTGNVTITNSIIQNNAARTSTSGNSGVGGGILLGSFTPMVLTNSQVLNNQASQTIGLPGHGGGINLGAFSHTFIHNSTISGNQTAGDGGGIWTNQGLTIDQGTIISGNTAGGSGGGMWQDFTEDFTSISEITIAGNSATGNGGGIHVDSGAPQVLNINFSRVVNNTAAAGSGFDNIGGQIDATDNWWGCNQGPSIAPCDTINDPSFGVTFDPWIVLSHTPNPSEIGVGNSSTLTASFLQDNHGTAIPVSNLSALIGLAIQFNNPVLGTLSNPQTSIQPAGAATVTYTANAIGAGHADALVDNATVTANIHNIVAPSIIQAFGAATILLSSKTGLTFTINNPNASVALTGVTFTDMLPGGLVVATPNGLTGSCGGGATTAIAGSSNISLAGATLAANASCTLSVNATGVGVGNQVNTTGAVSSTNGGIGNTATASIVVLALADLAITKTHSGNFSPGQTGATFSLTVSNVGGGATVGAVTVTDNLPAGLTATAISGLGWTCILETLTCTRADVLDPAGVYPIITVTVNVSASVAPNVTNTATVAGGGELNTANDAASDPTHTSLLPLQIIGQNKLMVTAGSATSLDFTVESSSGVGVITFACSGLPSGASCIFKPATENQITATVTMTITTTAGAASLLPSGRNAPATPLYAVLLPLPTLLGLRIGSRKKLKLRVAGFVAGWLLLLVMAGCGSSSSRRTGGTPQGSFPISITASSSTAQASTTVNLSVL